MKFFNTFDFLENFFPNSPIAFILFLFFFFLITTVFIYIIYILNKKEKSNTVEKNKKIIIDDLIKIAKNSKSNIKDLVFAIEYFNTEFKVENFPDKAFEFFKALLSHKNRNKILFDIFHEKTVKLNNQFEEQLNKIEKDCLNET